MFFDLSRLPERLSSPAAPPKCQEIQLWQPKIVPQPKKVSRFFPPRSSSPKLSVKLPSTACTLHKCDKGTQVDLPIKPSKIPRPVERVAEVTEDVRSENHDQIEASAANLWRILTTKDEKPDSFVSDPYAQLRASKYFLRPPTPEHRVYDTRMESIGAPVELDSTEVPYVHANSLTGEGNERASYTQRVIEDHTTVIYTSPINVTPPADEMLEGLNEMVVDHDMYHVEEKRYHDA